MNFFIAFSIVVFLLQVIILLICFMYRRDPLLMLPPAERVQVLVDLLQVRNHLKAVRLYAEALLRKPQTKLSLSQAEFTHQIAEESVEALKKMDRLVEPGRALSLDSALSQAHGEELIQHERSFIPKPYSILTHLENQKQKS